MEPLKTTQLCFKTTEEWNDWAARNCAKCIKNSYLKKDGTFTKVKCCIQRDLLAQAEGRLEIYLRNYNITQRKECSLFIPQLRVCSRSNPRTLIFPPSSS